MIHSLFALLRSETTSWADTHTRTDTKGTHTCTLKHTATERTPQLTPAPPPLSCSSDLEAGFSFVLAQWSLTSH